MTPKAEQLFLELCVLSRRYSAADIESIANISEFMNEPSVQNILRALRDIQATSPSAKRPAEVPKKAKRRATSATNEALMRKAISAFIESVTGTRMLRTRDQLDLFAQAVGVDKTLKDRQQVADAIRQKLEGMQPAQAMRYIRSADRQAQSDTAPYVNLAKTLMGTKG
ncbi:MAG: hypothetical protein ABSA66_09370 [Roseiarcus sp.]|jgi:hypothetical protein